MIAKLKKKPTVGVKKVKKLDKKVPKKPKVPKVKQEVTEIKEEPVEDAPKSSLKGISKRFNVDKPAKKNKIKKDDNKNTKDSKSGTVKGIRGKCGVVQIKCLPHGFYEEELREFFKQFGDVRRVRVVRSLETGRSTGKAYVEFRVPEVAEIAAETMNNYLLMKCILRTKYIPPEKVSPKLMTPRVTVKMQNDSEIVLSSKTCRRMKHVQTYNNRTTTDTKKIEKVDKKLEKKKRKLAEAGIDFDMDLVVKRPKPAPKDDEESVKEEEVQEKPEKTKSKSKKKKKKVTDQEELTVAPEPEPEKPAKVKKVKETLVKAPKKMKKEVKTAVIAPKVGVKKAKKSKKLSK